MCGWQEGAKNAHVKGFLERLAKADPRPASLGHLLDSAVSLLGGLFVSLLAVVVRGSRGWQIPGRDLYEHAFRHDGRLVSPLHA
jgi:hypothetical protein